MKFSSKTGILTAVLVLPVFVFLFLKMSGRNVYSIKMYYPLDSIEEGGKYRVTSYHTIPNFTLVNQDGHPFGEKDLKGNIYVADYFFTTCKGTCLKMTNQLKRVQESFAKDNEVKLVSFTVDPGHDTVDVLRSFAAGNGAIPGKWTFLTGQKDSIYTLAHRGFFISAGEEAGSEEAFLHSEKLILVDKEGRIRGYYNGTDHNDVDRLITEIKILQDEYRNSSTKGKE